MHSLLRPFTFFGVTTMKSATPRYVYYRCNSCGYSVAIGITKPQTVKCPNPKCSNGTLLRRSNQNPEEPIRDIDFFL
jgi:hypothetical protein